MLVWRLRKPDFAPRLDGEGARLWGGRWNSPGVPMIYTASSLSLAVLEYFVHMPAAMRQRDRLPDLIAVALDLRDDAVETLTLSGTLSLQDTRATGDNWISSRRSLGLSVPSRLIPLERNLLLNATHLLIGQVSVALQLPFQFDDWLGI